MVEFTKIVSEDNSLNTLQNNIETSVNSLTNELGKLKFNAKKMMKDFDKISNLILDTNNNITLLEDRVRMIEENGWNKT